MSLFKCKMCGGALEINNNETVATCEYCGTMQTLPKLDDDKRANMYDRANHFRRNNEFDKAMGIYEQILNEDNSDAEAYWSLVLCRYGIEYVEDPATHKRIPTVNRAQFTSIFDDDNYKSALKYADSYQKSIYEEEAKAINEIQKGILAISQNEEPFDIFICYKESDAAGKRTHDSVLANDLYHQLTQEGFKVFFARITLEDKLGSAYEPYIFAALNSSKVMVVLGTKPEYFNAVWVKNEWSRYLALIKQGEKKMLIPAYKDMDPYDLPEEFSHLQAQDMSKLGFMQDLIRGIKKIVEADAPKTTTVVKETVVTGGNSDTAPLLKRAFMFLEDGDWESASEYCEKVLDLDPENAQAYLGKLMAEVKVKEQGKLKDCPEPFDSSNNYQKAVRFADDSLKKELAGYIDFIKTRNRNTYLERCYQEALEEMKTVEESYLEYHESIYLSAAEAFEAIVTYKDSKVLAGKCRELAEISRKDNHLEEAESWMEDNDLEGYLEAIKELENIPGWKDADELMAECKKRIEEIKAEQARKAEEERQKREAARKEAEEREAREKNNRIIAGVVTAAVIAIIIILNSLIIPDIKYNQAIDLMNEEYYIRAIDAFRALDGYKESERLIAKCERLSMKSAVVGSHVKFGMYEQDNNLNNGKEEIDWLVIDKKENKLLLISKYIICGTDRFDQYRPSNEVSLVWEGSPVRSWLNSEFMDIAFSEYEQAMIPTVTVSADINPDRPASQGEDTLDKVFMLSIAEFEKYFPEEKGRCYATDYAVKAEGVYQFRSDYCSSWLLRTTGEDYYHLLQIDDYANLHHIGALGRGDGIRPAMWIDLNS